MNIKLANGATCLKAKNIDFEHAIVLARVTGWHPFVTWTMDMQGNTYSGHYFMSYDEAAADYAARQC